MSTIAVPGTSITIKETVTPAQSTTSVSVLPVYLQAFPSPKGREDMAVYNQIKEFEKEFGKQANFRKYGQEFKQAKAIINAGGTVICKRIVAPNSTLANAIIYASLKEKQVQKVDGEDRPLFIDHETELETTDVQTSGEDNAPIMITTGYSVKYKKAVCSNAKTLSDVEEYARTSVYGTEGLVRNIPLFVVSDRGRGISKKKFVINPDYKVSKTLHYFKYKFRILEGDEELESCSYTGNPYIVTTNNETLALDRILNSSSRQLRATVLDDLMEEFAEIASQDTNLNETEFINADYLFGKTIKNEAITNFEIEIADDALNLSSTTGITLEGGTNGSFGSAPVSTTDYANELVKFFNGELDDSVYDLDNYKIDIIPDANYPIAVKQAIPNLVEYRQDAVYLRDLGIRLTSLDDILAAKTAIVSENESPEASRFIADYHLSYMINDPDTKRPIDVTFVYDYAQMLVQHFLNGRARPACAEKYNFILKNYIEGSLSYIPVDTESDKRTRILCDNRINYCRKYDNKVVLDTEMTNDPVEKGPLTYLNNCFAVQQVAKALRTKCPTIRYSFIGGTTGFDAYERDVNTELAKYQSNFDKIKFEYATNSNDLIEKKYYATIKFLTKDFMAEEAFVFDVIDAADPSVQASETSNEIQ